MANSTATDPGTTLAPGGAGQPAADPSSEPIRSNPASDEDNDWLTLVPLTESTRNPATSAPWKPAGRGGGGAAMAPRGGSGNGGQAGVSAMVNGRMPRPAATSGPAAPPTIPGMLGGGPVAGATPSLPAPVVTRNAAAQSLAGGGSGSTSGGSGSAVGATSGSTSTTGVSSSSAMAVTTLMGRNTILENGSSLPSSTAGGHFAGLSFPYFSLYTIDQYNGVVLYPNQYQQAMAGGAVSLVAQVAASSSSSYTYSWTTSGTGFSNVSGTTTPNLQFDGSSALLSAQVDSVTLTVTNASSQQESQTYDFAMPATNLVTLPTSASWPVTISPDTVAPGAPAIASQNVSVDSISGALDTAINLPSYNPNVPALALTYNSNAAMTNPAPIILVHHTLATGSSVPTAVNAKLTFNGTAGTTWYYNTSGFIPGDVQQIALQSTATGLTTGRYNYSVQVVDERSTNTTSTYSGTATVLNQSSSAFGDGWTLQGLEQVIPASGGVILTLGANGETLWFSGSPGVGGNYTSPAGDFSTLTKTSTGYTRTLADGTRITFNASGYENATIDLNGLHTTFSYNGSNQLTSVEDPNGNVTTTVYDSRNRVSETIEPLGVTVSYTYDGSGNQRTVTDALGHTTTTLYDALDRATTMIIAVGGITTITYDVAGRKTSLTDPAGNTTNWAYNANDRVTTVTDPNGATVTSVYDADGELLSVAWKTKLGAPAQRSPDGAGSYKQAERQVLRPSIGTANFSFPCNAQ